MELSHNDNSSEIEAMSESSSVYDVENDGSTNVELQDVNEEEEERNPLMDSGIVKDLEENDDHISTMDDETADHESMDEEMNLVSYEREYQKNEVKKQLSTIFKLLKIDPIHD
ncbi:unnamed protein product [Rotaria socialis]